MILNLSISVIEKKLVESLMRRSLAEVQILYINGTISKKEKERKFWMTKVFLLILPYSTLIQ